MQRVVFLPLEPVDGRLHDGVRRLGRLLAVDPQADLLLLQERLEVLASQPKPLGFARSPVTISHGNTVHSTGAALTKNLI